MGTRVPLLNTVVRGKEPGWLLTFANDHVKTTRYIVPEGCGFWMANPWGWPDNDRFFYAYDEAKKSAQESVDSWYARKYNTNTEKRS